MPTIKCKVIKIEKFTSKKGNPCATVYIVFEGCPYPMKWVAFNRIDELPEIGSVCDMQIGFDRFMNARLELIY